MSNIPTLPGRPVPDPKDVPLDELEMIVEAEDIEEEEDDDVERLERLDAENFEKGGP